MPPFQQQFSSKAASFRASELTAPPIEGHAFFELSAFLMPQAEVSTGGAILVGTSDGPELHGFAWLFFPLHPSAPEVTGAENTANTAFFEPESGLLTSGFVEEEVFSSSFAGISVFELATSLE